MQKKFDRQIKSNAETDAVFQSIGEGAIATDDSGKIVKINKPALDILGYKKSEVIGKWFPKMIKAKDESNKTIALINRPVTQATILGKPISGKCYYQSKSKKWIPVFITVSPVVVNDKPIGAVEVFRDITKEEEVDRAKNEFISIASHQLRTPLTAIKTYSHLLNSGFRGKLTQKQTEFLEIIISAADRMNELITTLLDISKLEEGLLISTVQTVPIDDLITELVTELFSLADKKQIKIGVSYHNSKTTLETDPLLLKELLSNLLSNAIKYTPELGRIEILCKQNETTTTISIKDNGHGIPKVQQSRVFTKFFRGDNIVKLDAGGTGLGLYLVKKISEVLQATINFKSEEFKGTEFIVKLPNAPLKSRK